LRDYHIHDLRHICLYLPLSVAKNIATVLITTRPDYVVVLFFNIAFKDVTK